MSTDLERWLGAKMWLIFIRDAMRGDTVSPEMVSHFIEEQAPWLLDRLRKELWPDGFPWETSKSSLNAPPKIGNPPSAPAHHPPLHP